MDRITHELTADSVKALAHPIRVRLLGLLRLEGPATASALAKRTGESSGLTSYHLRQLEKAGFVAEDTTRGNARDRWWRAEQQFTSLHTTELDDDPETVVRALSESGANDEELGRAVAYAAALRIVRFHVQNFGYALLGSLIITAVALIMHAVLPDEKRK